jgi:hypothetical protein
MEFLLLTEGGPMGLYWPPLGNCGKFVNMNIAQERYSRGQYKYNECCIEFCWG